MGFPCVATMGGVREKNRGEPEINPKTIPHDSFRHCMVISVKKNVAKKFCLLSILLLEVYEVTLDLTMICARERESRNSSRSGSTSNVQP